MAKTLISKSRTAEEPLGRAPNAALAILFKDLKSAYRINRQPLDVSFRQLVDWLPYSSRATHFLHPYPSKLLFHIPYFFVNNTELCPPDGLVVDPFCGSGTTLLEAQLAGVRAAGLDINPFAVFLAKVKLERADPIALAMAAERVCQRATIPRPVAARVIPNARLWYKPATLSRLHSLWSAIESEPTGTITDALKIAFSRVAREVSLADPRMPVPVKVRPEKFAPRSSLRKAMLAVTKRAGSADVCCSFRGSVAQMCEQFGGYNRICPETRRLASVELADTRAPFAGFADSEIDLVITSPPYCGSQKYVRATSFALSWLGLLPPNEHAQLDHNTIGRDHMLAQELDFVRHPFPLARGTRILLQSIQAKNPTRAAIALAYLRETTLAMENTVAKIKRGGHIVLILGNSTLSGIVFPTAVLVRDILVQLGCRILLELSDSIRSRKLLTVRREDSSVITHETIILARKV